jgi:hypothetical protein
MNKKSVKFLKKTNLDKTSHSLLVRLDESVKIKYFESQIYWVINTAKKTHPVGLSDTASDTIVQCYVGQACPTGLSNMGSDNSVRCHVEQTWFNGFVQHGIGQLCPISCQTTMFNEFVRHGIKQVVQSHVGQHLSDEFLLIGQIFWFFWMSCRAGRQWLARKNLLGYLCWAGQWPARQRARE